ncbi:MAG: hypothetical protein IJX77_10060 [Ruminococcus sp.]|nr:hypothetical protein [Ruminococcus sp.]
MRFTDILKFHFLGYAPDMPTAWIARALKASASSAANFRTADGYYLRTADGLLFNVREESEDE